MVKLRKGDIERLFTQLNAELAAQGEKGELYLVGGAVMCLVYDARSATRDVDGLFRPARVMREAAARVAVDSSMPADWLNDAVKDYLSAAGSYDTFLSLSHLQVYVAQPEYLLAMKCLAMRIGAEFHDLDDVRFLLRYLNITDYKAALSSIEKYYPQDRIPQKTIYALEELLA